MDQMRVFRDNISEYGSNPIMQLFLQLRQ